MKKIKFVGIAGSGTMGSALAQKFAQENFMVYLYDVSTQSLERGFNSIKKSLSEAIEKKVFTENKVQQILSNIKCISDINLLKGCDLIIEAVFEDFKVKSELFKNLSFIVPADTILASNTSSFSITELAEGIKNPERFIGLHYFYHAAKNRLVEIIPSKYTSEDVIKSVYYFSLQSDKVPIFTKDKYGFAVNRFFVPWLNESVKIVESGLGTPYEVDEVAKSVFGIGMGPFALMNATGVPIAYHSQKTLEKFGSSYKVASLLKTQAESIQNWQINSIENINLDNPRYKEIGERLLGCVFYVCAQILNEEVCTPADLNKGARIGLKWKKGPVELMQDFGIEKVNQLIKAYYQLYQDNPSSILPEHLHLNYLSEKVIDSTAYIFFNKPEDLNALNEKVIKELDNLFEKFNQNNQIKNIIITSTGKYFVAGADIKFFVENIEKGSIDKIIQFTKYAQSVFNKIDCSSKRVIVIMNGVTLGGGLELALCADEIFALPNASMGFPETGIGIYPGLGGTQRPQNRIGKELTKYLVFTGKILRSNEALEINLIDNIISLDDYILVLEGNLSPLKKSEKKNLSENWVKIINSFNKLNIQNLSESDELGKIILQKAPLAISYANKLIDESKGPESELKYLKDIFTSNDALKGLKNIGKKVSFEGK